MNKKSNHVTPLNLSVKKVIQHAFLGESEKWPPECASFYYQPYRPEKETPQAKDKK